MGALAGCGISHLDSIYKGVQKASGIRFHMQGEMQNDKGKIIKDCVLKTEH
jgi:hypothetical protein